MKYKTVGIIGCAVVLIAGIINWHAVFKTDEGTRYHQHLEAQEKKQCTQDHSDGELCTHLPLVCIDTGGKTIPGSMGRNAEKKAAEADVAANGTEEERICAHMYIADSETEYNHPSDVPTVSSDILIHVRGNSSRYFDKLNYRIKLVDENGENNPQSLIGMDAHHEWALHGPFLDKTLIRNYMMYNIAGEIMDYSPNVRFCELMLNGEYMGVYVLTELIDEGSNGARLELAIDEKNDTYTGYLLRLDREDFDRTDNLNSFSSYTMRKSKALKLNVEFPGPTMLNEDIKKSINDDFSRFEKSLYSYDYNNKKYGYKNFIDMDSFAEYFIINEFTGNYDAGTYSTYIYKDTDGKLKMCVWDFNNSCDNFQEEPQSPVQSFRMQNKLWFNMLTKDEDFVECVIAKYKSLRKSYLSDEYLSEYIDDTVKYLGPAVERNYERWEDSFRSNSLLRPAERNIRSYEDALKQLKFYLLKRGKWMDENIDSLRQFCAESKVKIYNENTD